MTVAAKVSSRCANRSYTSLELERLLPSGVVTSPNYPGKYSDHLRMTDKIQVEQGLVITLQFTDFSTEKNADWMTITDGDGTPLMGMTSGVALPTNISSRTNVVNVLFHTDHSVTRKGWSFSWSAVAPGGSKTSLQIAAGSLFTCIGC